MFGTKQLIVNAHTHTQDNLNQVNLMNILKQAKKISQIIAYIWANDNATAKELDQYFKIPDSSENPLSSLLLAQKKEPAYELLKEVFKNHPGALPIFSESEREAKMYSFEVTYDRFQGFLADPIPGQTELVTMVIPYPPRPQIYDISMGKNPLLENAPLKQSDLEKWLDSDPNSSPYYYQENPYIPTTCC